MKDLKPPAAPLSLDTLTAQIKMKLVENHVLTNAFNSNVNQNSVAIGEMLTAAKQLVKHGQWQFWLADNFNMTDRTARNYMQVAEYFGGSSTLKTENVFRFQPAALIELSKLPVADVSKFLAENPTAENLSVRQLHEAITNFKSTARANDAENKSARQSVEITAADIQKFLAAQFPPLDISKMTPAAFFKRVKEWKAKAGQEVLRLPPPQFNQLPVALIDAAESANLPIDLQFGRGVIVPEVDSVIITRINSIAIKKFSAVADSVIFASPLEFVRSDGTAKRLNFAIWYSGGDIQNFADHFAKFGALFIPLKAKTPAIRRDFSL